MNSKFETIKPLIRYFPFNFLKINNRSFNNKKGLILSGECCYELSEDSRIITYKLALVGDASVGKTSLRKRYLGEGFKSNYMMTIGADFGVKRIQYMNKNYLLQIWDMSGQKPFEAVRSLYYRHANILVIVFDLSAEQTLDNILDWYDEFRKNSSVQNLICCIVGNKSDLVTNVNDKTIERVKWIGKEISKLTKEDVKFFTTSALSGENVNLLFDWIISQTIIRNSPT